MKIEKKECTTILIKLDIERSIEFVITGTEAVGRYTYLCGVKRRARLCLEQNGEHFQHLL
jgi:hypothetical protein